MNRRTGNYRGKRMLAATVLALCAVALAFPGATACAKGTEFEVARQDSDGYGTTWFVDPGEWYVTPVAPVARAIEAPPADDGYGTNWFVDPGEWYLAPEPPILMVRKPEPDEDGYGSTWFADPGEWYAETDGALALANQTGSSHD